MSSFGDIRLGPDSSEPDFSYASWMAMLFSAGMGIGLMFFGVAEPISHYFSPPTIEGGTAQAAREAMEITFFHWGIHAWAIYAVVGLSLAYFGYRRGLPLTIRSSLYPILGERIHGPIGHAVDILAVVSTMFGVATSLGVGVMQVNAGLNHLFGVPENEWMQLLLIALITGAGHHVCGGWSGFRHQTAERNQSDPGHWLVGFCSAGWPNLVFAAGFRSKYRWLSGKSGDPDLHLICL